MTFHVAEKSGKPAFDPTQPTITVTSPRGKIKKADAAKIVFDFFVTGCRLGPAAEADACQVVYRVNQDPQQVLTAWAPAFWENVPAGKHTFVAALYKGEKRVDAPFALVQGAFEVVDEAPAAAPAAPAG